MEKSTYATYVVLHGDMVNAHTYKVLNEIEKQLTTRYPQDKFIVKTNCTYNTTRVHGT